MAERDGPGTGSQEVAVKMLVGSAVIGGREPTPTLPSWLLAGCLGSLRGGVSVGQHSGWLPLSGGGGERPGRG